MGMLCFSCSGHNQHQVFFICNAVLGQRARLCYLYPGGLLVSIMPPLTLRVCSGWIEDIMTHLHPVVPVPSQTKDNYVQIYLILSKFHTGILDLLTSLFSGEGICPLASQRCQMT